jgi:hypothetical protein
LLLLQALLPEELPGLLKNYKLLTLLILVNNAEIDQFMIFFSVIIPEHKF